LRAAHLMMHRYGGDAELEAAKYADLMRGCGDRDGLLAWARIWRMIAVMHPTPTGLPHRCKPGGFAALADASRSFITSSRAGRR
jgi:hypothetical protein